MFDNNTGPIHYEGWSCEDCKFITMTTHLDSHFCMAKFENSRSCPLNRRIDNIRKTPSWCPYIKGAIMKRIMECD